MSQSNYHKIESGKTGNIDFKLSLRLADLLETGLSAFLPQAGAHTENDHLKSKNYSQNGIPVQLGREGDKLLKVREEIIRLQTEKIIRLEAELAALRGGGHEAGRS